MSSRTDLVVENSLARSIARPALCLNSIRFAVAAVVATVLMNATPALADVTVFLTDSSTPNAAWETAVKATYGVSTIRYIRPTAGADTFNGSQIRYGGTAGGVANYSVLGNFNVQSGNTVLSYGSPALQLTVGKNATIAQGGIVGSRAFNNLAGSGAENGKLGGQKVTGTSDNAGLHTSPTTLSRATTPGRFAVPATPFRTYQQISDGATQAAGQNAQFGYGYNDSSVVVNRYVSVFNPSRTDNPVNVIRETYASYDPTVASYQGDFTANAYSQPGEGYTGSGFGGPSAAGSDIAPTLGTGGSAGDGGRRGRNSIFIVNGGTLPRHPNGYDGNGGGSGTAGGNGVAGASGENGGGGIVFFNGQRPTAGRGGGGGASGGDGGAGGGGGYGGNGGDAASQQVFGFEDETDPYSIGSGGAGGRGGRGGFGGLGGNGGNGGGGGGAIDLVVLGTASVNGTIDVRGAAGQAGQAGNAGEAGQDGFGGVNGSGNGVNVGGRGGDGGSGGAGGRGANGGSGGNGTNGEFFIRAGYATVGTSASIDNTYLVAQRGGFAPPPPPPPGGPIIIGSDTGPRLDPVNRVNPYRSKATSGNTGVTPNIARLVDGADAFGTLADFYSLSDADTTTGAAYVQRAKAAGVAAPANAAAIIARRPAFDLLQNDGGYLGYAAYDTLTYSNLTGRAIPGGTLSANSTLDGSQTNGRVALGASGLINDSTFNPGAVGRGTARTVGANQTFVTLVDDAKTYDVSAGWRPYGNERFATRANLGTTDNQVLYLLDDGLLTIRATMGTQNKFVRADNNVATGDLTMYHRIGSPNETIRVTVNNEGNSNSLMPQTTTAAQFGSNDFVYQNGSTLAGGQSFVYSNMEVDDTTGTFSAYDNTIRTVAGGQAGSATANIDIKNATPVFSGRVSEYYNREGPEGVIRPTKVGGVNYGLIVVDNLSGDAASGDYGTLTLHDFKFTGPGAEAFRLANLSGGPGTGGAGYFGGAVIRPHDLNQYGGVSLEFYFRPVYEGEYNVFATFTTDVGTSLGGRGITYNIPIYASTTNVPEPTTLLAVAGIAGVALRRRRR